MIYMDYNSTCPIKPAVIERVTALMHETGNASSIHQHGRKARSHIEKAREQIAAHIKSQPDYITFTSGATESNNAVLKQFDDERILISAIEHPAVTQTARNAEFIPVNPDGIIDMAALEKMLETGPAPALISVMLVNNETGVLQPVADIACLARRKHKDIYIHTDAAQAIGRINIDFPSLQTDYMSLSSHKFGGPQGAGALITAPGARTAKLLYGGGQEKRLRAGTENIAGIAGMGLAIELAAHDIKSQPAIKDIRDNIEQRLKSVAPDIRFYGQAAPRVAGTSCFSCAGIASDVQMMNMDLAGFAVSNGSACSSGKVTPSHVLQAMGASKEDAAAALRISLGWGTTSGHAEKFVEAWTQMYKRLKSK